MREIGGEFQHCPVTGGVLQGSSSLQHLNDLDSGLKRILRILSLPMLTPLRAERSCRETSTDQTDGHQLHEAEQGQVLDSAPGMG